MNYSKILFAALLKMFVMIGFVYGQDTTLTVINGNVGIGTTSPASKLTIAGISQTTTRLVLDNTGAPANAARIDFRSQGTEFAIIRAVTDDNTDGKIEFYTANESSLTQKMVIDKLGNVGIGTTSPGAKLDVVGSAEINGQLDMTGNKIVNVTDPTSAQDAATKAYVDGVGGGGDFSNGGEAGGADRTLGNTDDFNLGFLTNNTTRLHIQNNGNVGIGTTSPASKLTIAGISETESRLVLDNTGAPVNAARIDFRSQGTEFARIRAFTNNNSDGEIQFYTAFANSLTEKMVIDQLGNVGIGTSDPKGTLDVNGSIYQRGGILSADYVFEPDYELESIEEHAEFMWGNKHLKAMPKAQVDENGQEIVEVGAQRKGIVEELEKSHIYIEQLLKRIKVMEGRLAKLEDTAQ